MENSLGGGPKKALITGITGQDGSYLAEFLIAKKYEVHGIIRRSSSFNTGRINHIYQDPHEKNKKLFLHYGNSISSGTLDKIIRENNFDEIYNLAAQSQVRVSFEEPEYTANCTGLGTLRILEALKNFSPDSKFYQAGSSEMFGKVKEIPQTEKTPFHPRSPYGCSKVFAHWITINYREAYNIFACNGILFNHESERRGETFVTRKITKALTRIKLGLQNKLFLGNLDAERDWGYAKDFVEAMWLMMQENIPDDYVIGTGEKHSVREFLEKTAKCLDLQIESNNKKGTNETYLDKKGKIILEIDSKYYRPAEVDILLANSEKAKNILGWVPKLNFDSLVKIMAEHDFKEAENELMIQKKNGN